ncbi:AaceriAFR605Cp [[Ashbya] aceris (nom. inval.)]|nr:AaceriAFR605Cp [[Ashbya] aceris (nom. inval.)]
MVPIVFNSETISGITGSISIACWVIVFVPQIYENFRRKSAEGLSLLFVVLWLAGDIFNLLGAILQHLLPTMIVLAAYYTIADIVLWFQCVFYGQDSEVDPVHLSPANPIHDSILDEVLNERQPLLHDRDGPENLDSESQEAVSSVAKGVETPLDVVKRRNPVRRYIFNALVVITVVLGGFLAWYISYSRNYGSSPVEPDLNMNVLAQFFGYLSAVLYLGSRVPQILLNFKRKSCEGISFLFFLFACLGNTTFIISVLSISLQPRYLLVNASWLLGSFGTLLMDLLIFVQFFIYGGAHEKEAMQTVHDTFEAAAN